MILSTGSPEKRLGKYIYKRFNCRMVSRHNGYDLDNVETRKQLVTESLEYDVFINNAKLNDFGQVLLLRDMHAAWESNKKSGHIINIGSTASYRNHTTRWYNHEKKTLRDYSIALSQQYSRTGIKVSIIYPGQLTLPNKEGDVLADSISPEHMVDTIEYVINSPYSINELSLDPKYVSR